MKTYEQIYESLCRVCLEYDNSENMVSLLENTSTDGLSCYGKSIATFADVLIKTDDNLPSMMCGKCVCLLRQAIRFKFKCEWTNKRLEIITKSTEVSEQIIKEKVVEYTLFTHYFPDLCSKKSTSDCTRNMNQEKQSNLNKIDQETGAKELNNFSDDDLDEVPLTFLSKNNPNDRYDEILDQLEKVIRTDYNKINVNYKENTVRKKIKRKTKLKSQKHHKYKYTSTQKTKKSNLICNICNKVLANESTYDYHMQRHNGCRFICEHCAKGFPVLSELQMHLLTRHGMGPYLQCPECPFKAPRRFDLIEHQRLHSGERPYTCEKCGLTFRRRGIWKKHLVHHSEKSIQCPLCPRKFHQRSDMLAHKNNIHERLYVYLCNKCGATYAKTDTVRKHLMERHGIPKELQGKITRVNKCATAFEA